MKHKHILIFLSLIYPFHPFCNPSVPGKTSLSGKITDIITGDPLPGVTIYIPDLRTGTVSKEDGTYLLEDLPDIKVLVQVIYIGYELIAEHIDLSTTTSKDFALTESHSELNEIVITGLSRSTEKNRTPTPITTVAQTELLENISTNIVDALAKQPGVSQVTTGVGISKPVIRGLGYNRVVVVHDGIRQEGQQWGDEHGIEIDEFGIHKVEILKGPASIAYGSDAMAGVIHLLSAPTLPEGVVRGNVLAGYQTNNGLIGYSGNVSGNNSGLIWDLRYSHKQAHAYRNQYDGFVLNSGFKENAIGAIVGLNKSWGYSHLHISHYDMLPGIIEGIRDSVSGMFIKEIPSGDTVITSLADEDDFKNYTPGVPYQKIEHQKLVLNNSFIIGQGSLKATLGFQHNRRKEFGDVLNADAFGLHFLLNSFHYDFRYLLEESKRYKLSVGLSGMSQHSKNEGLEFLIPEYNLVDLGVYAFASGAFGKLDISSGLRFDSRSENGKALFLDEDGIPVSPSDPEATERFAAFKTDFSDFSGSIGATYQFSKSFFSKINIAKGFRAPNIAELASNGEHEGTLRYEIGDPGLKQESSLQFDLALGLDDEHITSEIAVFTNQIDHFIYLQKLQNAFGGDSITGELTTYKFVAGDAVLNGGEIMIDFHPHPLDWLHFENSFSYVLAKQKNQPDSIKYLPFTPAPKWTAQLKATAEKLGSLFSHAYVMVETETHFKQGKIFTAFDTETETPGYTLLHAGLGADVMNKKTKLFSLYFFASNITDVAYQSHLSRLKYGDVNYATGRRGVFNMGRNFSLKLQVPIG